MAEVDTSSYPKIQPSNFLDTAAKFQGLAQGANTIQQQGLAINQAKLDQANQALGYMTRAMASLGPNATQDQYLAVGQNAVKMGLVPPQMLNTYVERLNQYKKPDGTFDSKDFYNEFVTAAATHQETINYHLGQPGTFNQGQQTTPVVTSPKFGMRATGLPIQNQPPPTTQYIDTNPTLPDGSPNPNYNRPTLLGPRSPVAPPGVATNPGQTPGSTAPIQPNPVRTLPIAPDKNINLTGPGKTITGIDVQDVPPPNKQVQNRFAMPESFATGQVPGYAEGLKARTEDQALATQKLTALKPLLAAMDLMKDLRSGPGTETWNKAVAFMKANNIIPTIANDPTAIYQEVNKYLNQYVSQNGTRSDADLAQREMSNPNVTQQINPALLKLTRSTIAQDRIQAARSGAFEGRDYQNYNDYRSKFPAQMDPRAFNIDKLDDPDRQKLLGYMLKNKDTAEGKRFFKSLEAAKRSGVLGTN